MKRQHMTWYVAALIAAVVTALALGAPASAVLLALVVLACPLMMMFMMGNCMAVAPGAGRARMPAIPPARTVTSARALERGGQS
jgi:hypothetical protein